MGTVPANKEEQKAQEVYNLNLTLLEEKVVRLVDMVKALKLKNEDLKKSNDDLKMQLEKLETSLVSETKDLEELSQEKVMTKMVVDDLIKSIDSLVDPKE